MRVLAHARDQPLAAADLGLQVEGVRAVRSAAREGAHDRLVLAPRARAVPGHVARAHVHEGGPLQAVGEGQHVADARDVGLEGRFQRRVEDDEAGAVHDHVHVLGDPRRLVFGQAEVLLGDVASHHHELAGQEGLEPLALARAQRIEGGRGQDHVAEAGPAVGGGADHQVHARDLREALQQHGHVHLAQEARAPEHEERAAGQRRAGGEGGLHGPTCGITMGGRCSMVTSGDRPRKLFAMSSASSRELARSQPRRRGT